MFFVTMFVTPGGALQCSNCGYENPREHRYCGMCGTPFPSRPQTVPKEQSTLAFTSAALEVAPAPLHPPVAQLVELPVEAATAEMPVATREEAVEELHEVHELPPSLVEAVGETTAVTAASEVLETHAPAVQEVAAAATAEAETPSPAQPTAPDEELVVPVDGWARTTAAEPEPEATEAPLPVEATREAPAEPAAIEPARMAAQDAVELEPRKPAPRVIAIPTARPRRVKRREPAKAEPVVIRPTPETLPFSPPPASAGMPTFKEIQEAAGPPPISPFEPPAEKHTDEDRELREYVASFRWTPPAETADELTMRSEVPVVDKEAPAEFHHPSFDDDVPPPPEAGPHPTGEEYYPPSSGSDRSRFLEIYDKGPGESEGELPAAPGSEGDTAPHGNKRWIWGTVAALVAVFGGLVLLKGRAQSTHAFRGPVEVVRSAYYRLRAQMAEPSSPGADRGAGDNGRQTNAPAKPEATGVASLARPQTNAPAQKPVETTQPAQTSPTQAWPESKAGASAAAPLDAAKTVPAPPAPKPSAKPQPGQQELDKAMKASDPTAAAAWLWKATSRGNPEAPVRLADMYIKGNGVPKSCEQAMVLLRSAATKENAPARNRLAALYANGTCVARDRVKAYQLMSSALTADPSSEWAKESREVLWNQMTPKERAEAQKYR
jgi:hypothetical protein